MTDELLPDIEIGRYGLRTFAMFNAKLSSLYQSHTWDQGTAIAACRKAEAAAMSLWTTWGEEPKKHVPCESSPGEDCTCGLYATLTIDQLCKEYGEYVRTSGFAVVAAEGITYLGTKGMRTAAARVVDWWAPEGPARKVFSEVTGITGHDNAKELLEKYSFEMPGCDAERVLAGAYPSDMWAPLHYNINPVYTYAPMQWTITPSSSGSSFAILTGHDDLTKITVDPNPAIPSRGSGVGFSATDEVQALADLTGPDLTKDPDWSGVTTTPVTTSSLWNTFSNFDSYVAGLFGDVTKKTDHDIVFGTDAPKKVTHDDDD